MAAFARSWRRGMKDAASISPACSMAESSCLLTGNIVM
jgi:hypothetical protein